MIENVSGYPPLLAMLGSLASIVLLAGAAKADSIDYVATYSNLYSGSLNGPPNGGQYFRPEDNLGLGLPTDPFITEPATGWSTLPHRQSTPIRERSTVSLQSHRESCSHSPGLLT